jgi:hypothetical protein
MVACQQIQPQGAKNAKKEKELSSSFLASFAFFAPLR